MANQVYRWTGSSGSFDDPNHWVLVAGTNIGPPAGPPAPNDQAFVASADSITAGALVVNNRLDMFNSGPHFIELDASSLTVGNTNGKVFDTGHALLNVGPVVIDGPSSQFPAALIVGGTQEPTSQAATLQAGSLTIGDAHFGLVTEGFGDTKHPAAAVVTVGGTLALGNQSGSSGELDVYDVGDSLSAASVFVGNGGSGTLRLHAGTTFAANLVAVGNQQDSDGTLSVDGANFDFSTNTLVYTAASFEATTLDVGKAGTGRFSVASSAQATITGSLTLGQQATGDGALTVGNKDFSGAADDSDTILEVQTLFVGMDGHGSATVQHEATLHADALGIGSFNSGDGDVVTVTGSGTTLEINHDALIAALNSPTVGHPGLGTLNVTAGAFAFVGGIMDVGEIGAGNANGFNSSKFGEGSVAVDGTGSVLQVGSLQLGGAVVDTNLSKPDCGDWSYDGGVGTLAITNNALVKVDRILQISSVDQIGFLPGAIVSLGSGGSLEIGHGLGVQSGQILIDADGTLAGHGLVSAPASSSAPIEIVNNGVIDASDGYLNLDANVSGSGTTYIERGATLDLYGSFSGKLAFNGPNATLVIENPYDFHGTISGLQRGDIIDLGSVNLPATTISHTEVSSQNLTIVFQNNSTLTYQLDAAPNGSFAVTDLPLRVTNAVTPTSRVSDPGLVFEPTEAPSKVITGVAGTGYGSPYIDSLISGWAKWNSSFPITVFFGTTSDLNDAVHAHGPDTTLDCGSPVIDWQTAQINAINAALQIYSNSTALRFVPAASAVDANLVFWIVPPSSLPQVNGQTVDASTDPLAVRPDGHAWIELNADRMNQSLVPGGYTFETMLHEIGHAMGLSHPHDGGRQPDASTFPGVPSGVQFANLLGTNFQNQSVYTVESYIPGWNGVGYSVPANEGMSKSLGAFDIAALQDLYGANTTFHRDDDVYQLPSTNASGVGWTAIWDTGGHDTITSAGSNVAAVIDLMDAPLNGPNAGGLVSYASGVLGGFTIANGVVIEDAIGGNGNDILIGNSADNVLDGGAGQDIAYYVGNSTSYSWHQDLTSANTWIVDGPDGHDTLINDELLRFSDTTITLDAGVPLHGRPHWATSVDVGAHPPGWSPVGIGDFNGDATSDLAWFNASTGDMDIWKLQNGHWAGSSDVGTHPAGYSPVSFGDFNHDGTSDLLWFNATTRDVDLWKIANGQWAGSVDIGTHPAAYQPSLTGDFNGDGTSDIGWYNAASGDVDIWKIANGQWAGSVDVGSHPAGYQPALTGDFNGDGTSDIAWYNAASGDVDIWKLADGQWAGSIDVGFHPAGWQPLGAADFDADGTSDIAWYNPTTNDIEIWLVKNGQWNASVDIGTHPAGSVAVAVGDFDHNGVPDIMWQNTNNGHIDNWMLASA